MLLLHALCSHILNEIAGLGIYLVKVCLVGMAHVDGEADGAGNDVCRRAKRLSISSIVTAHPRALQACTNQSRTSRSASVVVSRVMPQFGLVLEGARSLVMADSRSPLALACSIMHVHPAPIALTGRDSLPRGIRVSDRKPCQQRPICTTPGGHGLP